MNLLMICVYGHFPEKSSILIFFLSGASTKPANPFNYNLCDDIIHYIFNNTVWHQLFYFIFIL